MTVFSFFQECPWRFYSPGTRTQSCAHSFHRLEIYSLQSQRWLSQCSKILCDPRDSNQVSLNLPAILSVWCSWARGPAPHSGTTWHPLQGFGGSCCSVAFCSPGHFSGACSDFPFSGWPSWTLLFASVSLSWIHPNVECGLWRGPYVIHQGIKPYLKGHGRADGLWGGLDHICASGKWLAMSRWWGMDNMESGDWIKRHQEGLPWSLDECAATEGGRSAHGPSWGDQGPYDDPDGLPL